MNFRQLGIEKSKFERDIYLHFVRILLSDFVAVSWQIGGPNFFTCDSKFLVSTKKYA